MQSRRLDGAAASATERHREERREEREELVGPQLVPVPANWRADRDQHARGSVRTQRQQLAGRAATTAAASSAANSTDRRRMPAIETPAWCAGQPSAYQSGGVDSVRATRPSIALNVG